MIGTIVQALFLLVLPAAVLWLQRRSRFVRAIGAVLVCYLVGIALANQPLLVVDTKLSMEICAAMIALAIPLLLFSLDVVAWLRFARPTILSFVLILVSVMCLSTLAHLMLGNQIPDSHKIAGMLVGVYTGGTPNMAAIGTALGVPSETFVLLNAADILTAAFYLPYLLTFAAPHFARLLPPTPRSGADEPDAKPGEDPYTAFTLPSPRGGAAVVGLGALIVAAGLGLSKLLPGFPQESLVLLTITTLAIAASFIPRVRAVRGSGDLGQYLLLVFCVAIGSTSDFRQLEIASLGLVAFVAMVMFGSVLLHLLLAMLLRIDRDTVIVTSTAAIFGPAFVGPVVLALRNREMMISGMTSGLVGFAVGNYLGLGLAWLLGG